MSDQQQSNPDTNKEHTNPTPRHFTIDRTRWWWIGWLRKRAQPCHRAAVIARFKLAQTRHRAEQKKLPFDEL